MINAKYAKKRDILTEKLDGARKAGFFRLKAVMLTPMNILPRSMVAVTQNARGPV